MQSIKVFHYDPKNDGLNVYTCIYNVKKKRENTEVIF